MMGQYHVVVIRTDGDPRVLGPQEALLHARAEFFRSKYRATLSLVVVQVSVACLMAAIGTPAHSIVIGILGGALLMSAHTGLIAWRMRKDIIQ